MTEKIGFVPQRVVSLVPSITESIFDLGLGTHVVGITDYCIYPPEAVLELSKVGGPRDARVEDILALNPDLVIANQEENQPELVNALRSQGVYVWVTFPKSVGQAMDILWEIAETFKSEVSLARVRTLEMAMEWAQAAAYNEKRLRYFCPIWEDQTENGLWWMTFNAATYSSDLLSLFGGENIFASRLRRYPLSADLGMGTPEEPQGRDVRYPRVSAEEIHTAQPELILLPSEPFLFTKEKRENFLLEFSDTPAVRDNRVYLVDGSLITWFGTRLVKALEELPAYFAE